MYEILNSFKQKSIPKFQQKLINFENPKIFQKPQNLGFKTWNACKWEKKNTYQVIWGMEMPKITWVEGLEGEESIWEVKRRG